MPSDISSDWTSKLHERLIEDIPDQFSFNICCQGSSLITYVLETDFGLILQLKPYSNQDFVEVQSECCGVKLVNNLCKDSWYFCSGCGADSRFRGRITSGGDFTNAVLRAREDFTEWIGRLVGAFYSNPCASILVEQALIPPLMRFLDELHGEIFDSLEEDTEGDFLETLKKHSMEHPI